MFTFFAKGRTHKYIKKIPVKSSTGKQKWRYIYPSDLSFSRKQLPEEIKSGNYGAKIFAAMPPSLDYDNLPIGTVISHNMMHLKLVDKKNGDYVFQYDHEGDNGYHGSKTTLSQRQFKSLYEEKARKNNRDFVEAKLQSLRDIIESRQNSKNPLTRREMGRVKAALTRLEKTEAYKYMASSSVSGYETQLKLSEVRSLTNPTQSFKQSPYGDFVENNTLIEKAVPSFLRTESSMTEGVLAEKEPFANMFKTFFTSMRYKKGLIPEEIRNLFKNLSAGKRQDFVYLLQNNSVLELSRNTKPAKNTMYNDYLLINPPYRKYKMSTQLYIMQERAMRLAYENAPENLKKEARTEIDANIDIGKYAWAMEGFCYKNNEEKKDHLESVESMLEALISLTERSRNADALHEAGMDWIYKFCDKDGNPLRANEIFDREALQKLLSKVQDEFPSDAEFQPYRLCEIDKEMSNLMKRDFYTIQIDPDENKEGDPIPCRTGKLLMLLANNWGAKKHAYPELHEGAVAKGYKAAAKFAEQQRFDKAKEHGWGHLYKID